MDNQVRILIDNHFKNMRGKIFSLAEASLPKSQAEGFKNTVRRYTQTAWKSILKDLDALDDKEDESDAEREREYSDTTS